MPQARVVSIARSAEHSFSKDLLTEIVLLAGLGVEGDAHAGETVRHRSRVARDPLQPNLRQVHLLQAELLETLGNDGFSVSPGDLGENILTSGVALLELPQDCRLFIGETILRVTGLRNPCGQIEQFREGLLERVLERSPDGQLVRKAGIMSVVERGGAVRAGDSILIELPTLPHRSLTPV